MAKCLSAACTDQPSTREAGPERTRARRALDRVGHAARRPGADCRCEQRNRARHPHDAVAQAQGCGRGLRAGRAPTTSRKRTAWWVDLCDPSPDGLATLAEELLLDPHAVEDSLATAERPKATRHSSHTFVTVYATRLVSGDGRRGVLESRLETDRLSVFVLPGGVVTVRPDDRFDMDEVVGAGATSPTCSSTDRAPCCTGFSTSSSMVTSTPSRRWTTPSRPSRTTCSRRPAPASCSSAYRLRKELVELRRVVLPMREVVNTVMRHRADSNGHTSDLDGWYTDLYDHVLRASEWTESLRDMITTVFETNIALQDARLNVVMKKLTGWAAIIAVPTAVTGWFGMNVAYPGIGKTSGFVASAVVIPAWP